MIRIIIAFILILQVTSLSSQITFTSRHSNYRWVYQYLNYDIPDKNIVDTISRDSVVVDGKEYRKFSNFLVRDNGYQTYVRRNASPASKEYMVFDFSKNLGDTFNMVLENRTVKLTVLDKRKQYVETDSLILMKVEILDTLFNRKMYWLESVGCITGENVNLNPINWPATYGFDDIGFKMICYLNKTDESLLGFFGISCFDHNLLNPSRSWYTWASTQNGDNKTPVKYNVDYTRDTTVNGLQYFWMSYNKVFARYDGSTKSFFMLSSPDEILLFKTDAVVNDTIFHIPGTRAEVVSSITNEFIGKSYRRAYKTDRDVFYSGMGPLNFSFFDPNQRITIPEYQSGNVCFEDEYKVVYNYKDYSFLKSCNQFSSISNAQPIHFSVYQSGKLLMVDSDKTMKPNSRILIYDLMGKVILDQTMSSQKSQIIDISCLSSGLYIIHVQNDFNLFSTKVWVH